MESLDTKLSEFEKDLDAVERVNVLIRCSTFTGEGAELVYRTIGLLNEIRLRLIREIENEKSTNTED